MTKTRAFLIHLAISLVIFAVLATIIRVYWYPDFFFDIDGGWQGLRLIFGVDLVMGPLLTLIVYKTGKAGLKFDLTLIGLFQSACLCAGLWVVHSERPLVLVYADGHFYSLSAGSFEEFNIEFPDLAQFPGAFPKKVWIDLPQDPIEQSAVRKQAILAGLPLRLLVDRYQPFELGTGNMDKAYSQNNIRKKPQGPAMLDAWHADHPGVLEDYAFFPLGTRYNYLFMGFKRDTAEFTGLLLGTGGPL